LFSHDLWEKFVTEIALSLFNLSRVESKALAIDLTIPRFSPASALAHSTLQTTNRPEHHALSDMALAKSVT
jgi:hypothetical protein